MNSNGLILIIDDEPIIQQTLASFLEDQFDLALASNGKQGLELAAQRVPDVILLDIMMPGLDGYQVCRALRADPHLAEVPVIMLTALDDRDSKLAGLMAGADDFLTKPFDSLEMRIRLNTLLRLNRFGRLAAERARFSWIVEQAEDGYLLLDSNDCLQYANPQAQRFLHLPETYQDVNFVFQVERIYQVHPAERWVYWPVAPAPIYLVQPETSFSRPFWLLADAHDAPLGRDSSRLVRLRDVTEKMSVYQDMRRFHTTVAHKLRTPIALIYSALALLAARIDETPPAEAKDMIQTAWKGARRLLDSVRDVLNYLDAPLTAQLGSYVSLNQLAALAQKTAEMLALPALKIDLPPGLANSTLVLTGPALELILTELFENAKKFHPHHAPQVEIELSPVDRHALRLRISDDGLTLTAEQLSWVWLPYFQSEKNFSGEIPGMGLGFPMVATVVWQAGGKLRLSNREVGPGIVVELIIPMVNEEDT